MAKKSLFERMGLVESVQDEEDLDVVESQVQEYEEPVDVNIETVSQDNLIEDIYNGNNLSDRTRSIFKVEQLINSLPKEMPSDTKKSTVLTILSSFNLTVDEITEDGRVRENVVKAAFHEIVEDNNAVIENNNATIEQKKKEIQELEKDNANRKNIIQNTEDKVEVELKRITELMKFIGGEK